MLAQEKSNGSETSNDSLLSYALMLAERELTSAGKLCMLSHLRIPASRCHHNKIILLQLTTP